MNANRFAMVVRELRDRATRRTVLLLGGSLPLFGAWGGVLGQLDVDAKKKHRRKNKKKKKRKNRNRHVPCTPSCAGKACGSDGCGGSCGPCAGGECQDGACVCPFGGQCSPGVCCQTGQTCPGDECQACPVGVTPCDVTLTCGQTAGGKPCACATTTEGQAACILADLPALVCFNCAVDQDCATELGVPAGDAVCIGGLADCDFCEDTAGKACVRTCLAA